MAHPLLLRDGMCVTICEMKKGDRDSGNLYGSFSDSFEETKDHFEQVSSDELSYLKETQSSIISGRRWHSWGKSGADNASLTPQTPLQPDYTSLDRTSPQNHPETDQPVIDPPASNGRRKTYNKHFALLTHPQLPSVPSTELAPRVRFPKWRDKILECGTEPNGKTGCNDTLFSHSELTNDASQADSNPLIEENTWGDGDSMEQDDPELLGLTIIDEDYTDQQESGEDQFLEGYSIQEDSSPEPTFDWLSIDTDEFEDEISQYSEIEIKTDGKITRPDRAFQVALNIGEDFDLERDEIEFLTEVFIESGWSATKTSILQALYDDATIEELRLAYDLKLFWQEHPEFTSGYSMQYDILSWPTALLIVRSFGSYPDLAEIETLLFRIYEYWEENSRLHRIYRVFGQYVYYRFGGMDRTLDFMPEWTFEADALISHDWLTPPSSLDIPNLSEFKSERQLCKTRLKYAEN